MAKPLFCDPRDGPVTYKVLYSDNVKNCQVYHEYRLKKWREREPTSTVSMLVCRVEQEHDKDLESDLQAWKEPSRDKPFDSTVAGAAHHVHISHPYHVPESMLAVQ